MGDGELYGDHVHIMPLDDEAQSWLTAPDHVFGDRGEDFIRKWLEQEGYVFCSSHFKPGPLAEVDLIMKSRDDDPCYLFLEVKSRRQQSLEDPQSYEGLIHPSQRARLTQLAEAFAERHQCVVVLLLAFLTVECEPESLKFSWRLMPLL